MMRHRVLLMVSLLLLLSLGFTAVAAAADIEGTGRIWAKGAGYARIRGDGVVNVVGHGAAVVWIRGADTLRAVGDGRRWELPNGTVVYAGWRGLIHAEGDGLSIRMLGGIIEFTAEGTGWLYLRGRGEYIVNGEFGHWTLEGVRLALTPRIDAE
jgi:hypothetical protein